jgi:glucose-6-phosphate isomerase
MEHPTAECGTPTGGSRPTAAIGKFPRRSEDKKLPPFMVAVVHKNIDELVKDKVALKKHFQHIAEVHNNHVWLIHIYKEFIHTLNKEIYGHNIPQLNKVVDTYNKRLLEARRLCKILEPESFMKTSLLKITHLTKGETDGSV